jgi:hypothetical protein
MSSKAHLPPVPPANRDKHGDSDAGAGKIPPEKVKGTVNEKARHIEQQDQEGNIHQNTRNQGFRQTR